MSPSTSHQSFHDQADAFARLLAGIEDPGHRERVAQRVIGDIERLYLHAGMQPPRWVTRLRASPADEG